MRRTHALFSLLSVAASLAPLARAGYSTIINDFVDPDFLLSDGFDDVTVDAQDTIIQWAEMLNAEGPWAVTTTKNVTAPSGDAHDYLSWAPYAWPNCTAVGNTTELTDEEIWSQCTYYTRDGEFNPDVRFVNNTGAFGVFADAVFYNVMAWRITGKDYYAANASSFINTWFLDSDTAMNPNLNYGQVTRGPEKGSTGTHTGVLDLKCMSKIASGILALRQGKATSWTSDMDTAMKNWTTSYISWMESNELALQEAASDNNHGSFYFVQLASLYLITDNKAGALNVTQFYFDHAYQNQINATGEQPLEAIRTRPYHYRCYNLVAMLSNAKISAYAGKDQWNTTTANGATIKNALDFTMTVDPGDDAANELWLPVAAGAYAYGNGDDTYGSFLLNKNPEFGADPYFFWYRPTVNAAAWDSDAKKNMPESSNSTTGGDRSSGGAIGQARGELGLVGAVITLAGLLLI